MIIYKEFKRHGGQVDYYFVQSASADFPIYPRLPASLVVFYNRRLAGGEFIPGRESDK